MSYKIDQIEGIGSAYAQKLNDLGLSTTDDLLEKGAQKNGRSELASATGISESMILRWTNHADLFRVSGVAGQFAELLEAAGVDSVKEFRNRNAENLHAKLVEINAEKKLVGRVPALDALSNMIDQAKTLEPKISH